MDDLNPADLTQLDLQDLPPKQAAVLARAQQAALAAQQRHALLGMLGTVPELQEAGKAEYLQGARERQGGQSTAANVLKTALGEKEAAMRLKELENQGMYQRGQLAIGMGQLQEGARAHRVDEGIREVMTKPTVPPHILEGMSEDERKMAQLDALAQTIPGISWVTELAKKPLQAAHEATKKTLAGYRAMGAQGVPPEAAPAAAAPASPAVPAGRVKGVLNGQVKYVDPHRVDEAVKHGWVPAP